MSMHFFLASVCNTGNSSALLNSSPFPHACANSTTTKTIFLILFSIIGGLALLFMVIGGARYALSKGEPDNIQKAKNELKYSAIGLIITALAAAIVNFFIGRLQ